MSEKIYAVIDKANANVDTLIVYNPESEWPPEKNFYLVPLEETPVLAWIYDKELEDFVMKTGFHPEITVDVAKGFKYENNCFRQVGDKPPLPVPEIVEMRQLRLAMIERDLLGRVADAIGSIQDSKQAAAVQVEWEYSTVVKRSDQWLTNLCGALGMSESAIDSLFRLAMTK